jgi:hypothetical protein
MGGLLLSLIGLASSCMGVAGIVGANDDRPITPLAEASSSSQPVRVAGRLHATAPVRMPDDGSMVVRGRLRVALAKSGEQTPTEVLDDWAEDAAEVVLTDGTNALSLLASTLPLRRDRRARGSLTRTSVRGGQPQRAEYGDKTWELEPSRYDHGGWRLEVERELLAQDEAVVVSGRMVDGRLAPTRGAYLDVDFGTPDEVASSHARAQMMMACVGPLMLLLGLAITVLWSLRMAKERVAGVTRIGSMLG